MEKWNQLANQKMIEETMAALKSNGINAHVVENRETAKKKVLELLPEGAEVMTMTSMTLEAINLDKEINESGKYTSIRNNLMAMNRETQLQEMKTLGAVHEWVIGSVHAVTQDGHLLIASNSGSQLGSYAYGAANVIWVVGTQKIVKNMEEGIRRIYEHSFPLEDERARKAYGMPSGVSKILIFNKEIVPGRTAVIFVKERLGF